MVDAVVRVVVVDGVLVGGAAETVTDTADEGVVVDDGVLVRGAAETLTDTADEGGVVDDGVVPVGRLGDAMAEEFDEGTVTTEDSRDGAGWESGADSTAPELASTAAPLDEAVQPDARTSAAAQPTRMPNLNSAIALSTFGHRHFNSRSAD